MENLVITGSTSNTLTPPKDFGIVVKNIEIDLPLPDLDTANPLVTISGSTTGAYLFHSDASPELRYTVNEDVVVTTSGFNSDYSTYIHYIYYGDQTGYLEANTGRPNVQMNTPRRFK